MTKGLGYLIPSEITDKSGPLVTAPFTSSMGSSRPPTCVAGDPALHCCGLRRRKRSRCGACVRAVANALCATAPRHSGLAMAARKPDSLSSLCLTQCSEATPCEFADVQLCKATRELGSQTWFTTRLAPTQPDDDTGQLHQPCKAMTACSIRSGACRARSCLVCGSASACKSGADCRGQLVCERPSAPQPVHKDATQRMREPQARFTPAFKTMPLCVTSLRASYDVTLDSCSRSRCAGLQRSSRHPNVSNVDVPLLAQQLVAVASPEHRGIHGDLSHHGVSTFSHVHRCCVAPQHTE